MVSDQQHDKRKKIFPNKTYEVEVAPSSRPSIVKTFKSSLHA